MIRFRHPKLLKMKSGLPYIELTEEGTWESFPAFAEKFAVQLRAEIGQRLDGPDVRRWTLTFSGQLVYLHYDDFPNGVFIKPTASGQTVIINELFARFAAEASADGI